ncbi:MAG TPA: PepSY-like domain-containing protein [Chitinispirillaceae bacterium]|nr:PepSY-like domain-containing protein [Chitinispirillaceae bacterium]
MGTIIKLTLLGMIVMLAVPVFPTEQEIPEDHVPSAVLESFSKSFPDVIAQCYATVTRKEETCYEIQATEEKISSTLLYDSNGTLVESVEKIPSDSLPAPVQDFLKSTYKKISFMIAERIFKNNQTTYSVLLAIETSIEVKFFNPDGSIVNAP